MSGETPGPPADVYSFALLLWSLLTLEEPWAGTQTWQVGRGVARACCFDRLDSSQSRVIAQRGFCRAPCLLPAACA